MDYEEADDQRDEYNVMQCKFNALDASLYSVFSISWPVYLT